MIRPIWYEGYLVGQDHGNAAKRVTQAKMVWTMNAHTGLYYYKRRKGSVVRCDGNMGILVGTMGQLDGAGDPTGTAGDRVQES